MIHITTANITDRQGALEGFASNAEKLESVEAVLCDGSYTGENFSGEIRKTINAEVQIAKRHELHKFAVLPKRWVVERSFAWLEKCRGLWKNCERKLNTSLQMCTLAFISLILKRF